MRHKKHARPSTFRRLIKPLRSDSLYDVYMIFAIPNGCVSYFSYYFYVYSIFFHVVLEMEQHRRRQQIVAKYTVEEGTKVASFMIRPLKTLSANVERNVLNITIILISMHCDSTLPTRTCSLAEASHERNEPYLITLDFDYRGCTTWRCFEEYV